MSCGQMRGGVVCVMWPRSTNRHAASNCTQQTQPTMRSLTWHIVHSDLTPNTTTMSAHQSPPFAHQITLDLVSYIENVAVRERIQGLPVFDWHEDTQSASHLRQQARRNSSFIESFLQQFPIIIDAFGSLFLRDASLPPSFCQQITWIALPLHWDRHASSSDSLNQKL